LKVNPFSDITLLNQLAAGREEAFTQLYSRYSPGVYNALMIYIKDEHQADDLLQNVFVRLWEKRGELYEVKNIENYLFILARNMVLNHIKRKAIEENVYQVVRSRLVESADSTEDKVLETEYKRILQEAIDSLPAQQKHVYLMATEASMSYEDIASQMGLSKLTIKKHLELARKSIRAHINAKLHGYVVFPVILASGVFFHAIA
jgi:RNA polymerase sigma-70 factor (ECF subfamily)